MKRILFLCLLSLFGLSLKAQNYVDLGLPSGTRWADQNENLASYENALRDHDNVPTKEQWEELQKECKWTWTRNGYNVQGPSGDSIFLPAQGYYKCGGFSSRINGGEGHYWTSSRFPKGSAWSVTFTSGEIEIEEAFTCFVFSVRLVKKYENK